MENKCKRFLSLLLAFVMVLGLFPMGHAHVHAAEDSIMVLEPVTEVTAGVAYVIKLHNTDHAMNNNVSEWKSGHTGIETAVTEDFTDSFKWILEEQTENSDQGSYKIRNVGANQYAVVVMDKGYLDANGEGFNFTYTDDGWVIQNPARPYGYFNNLGGSNKIGGWNSDGTKFDIYRFVEKDIDEIDPWGKRNWIKVSVDTETIYSATEGNFEYAWDGNLGTIWHSNWQTATDKLDGSNTFTGIIDFSKEHTINQFSFTPRTGNNSGQVTQASVYVKGAEGEWKLVAEHAEFAANGSKKTVCFETQAVQYVKFVAEQSNDGWVAVAEFDIDNVAGEHTITETVTRVADCTNPGVLTCTCTCGNVYTKKIPVNPENHTVVFNDAKKPTLCETGFTGNRVCGGCGISLGEGSEITQLPVANVLSDNKLVALNGCEYTYNGNSLTHTAADGTTYYVKPASFNTTSDISGKGGQAPQTTTAWTGLSLNWQENGSVWIEGDGSMHIWTSLDKPYWDKCGNGHSWNPDNGTHDLYLFRANGELTGDVFPGYTQISSAEGMVTGEKYLIAAQKGDAWYIMHPSASNNAYDHLALVSGELHTITGHNYDEGVYTEPTYEADGYTTYTCSICGHSYTEVDEGSSLKNNFASELITGITGEASSNDAGDGSNIEEAFDGIKDDAGNYWASVANSAGIENNEYLIANLGGKYLINQVAYTSRNLSNAVGNLKNFTIWVKTDDTEWKAVASTTEVANPGTTTVTFAPVEATQVKLTATESCHWQSSDVNTVMAAAEFEVFKAVCVEHTPGAEATCTEDQICTVCGTVLVAAHHTPAEAVEEKRVESTCSMAGSYDSVVYCSVCGEELSRETVTVAALGHTAGEPVVENEVAADCTNEGSYDNVVYCTVCGEELSRETFTVGALGHTAGEPVVENNVDPTCTEAGSYDNVVYCTVCDAEISRETVPVPAKGHRFSKVEVTPATCTEDGYVTITCGNCNKTFVSGKDAEADQYLIDHPYFDLKAKGHTAGEPVVENEVAADCTTEGSYDTVIYCSVCDAEISRETTVIPAAHSYVNGGYLTQRCCTVCNAICEGFDNDSLYINGWLQQAYQLVEYQGAIYFVGDAHKIVKDTTYYLTEEFTNGEFFPDGRAIQPGYYEFDADGKMLIPEAPAVKNGVIDGYLYIDDQMQKAYQLVEFEGSLYFISDAHRVAVGTSLYLNENFVAGVKVPGTDRELVPGYYEFDAEGKMLIPEVPAVKNGVIDGYLYINDQMQKAYQLVEFEGSLYFISDAHKVAVSTSLYLNEDFVAGVMVPGTDKALKPGYYEFDAEGKMLIPEVKEGVIDGYLYIDGELQLAYQLVEFDNHMYFVYDAHKVAVSTRLYLSQQFVEGKTFNGEPIAVGYYEFDENGWMIIE